MRNEINENKALSQTSVNSRLIQEAILTDKQLNFLNSKRAEIISLAVPISYLDQDGNVKTRNMKNEQYRWYLQIRFKNNGDLFFMRTWCINEPYKTLRECESIAEGLLDDTVERMRIVDGAKNDVYKQYR